MECSQSSGASVRVADARETARGNQDPLMQLEVGAEAKAKSARKPKKE